MSGQILNLMSGRISDTKKAGYAARPDIRHKKGWICSQAEYETQKRLEMLPGRISDTKKAGYATRPDIRH